MELFLVIWLGFFVYIIGKNIARWVENEHSPILTVPARIVAMRRKTHHHNHNGHAHIDHTYHITFELETGERLELRVKRREYQVLTEGDRGTLTYQGTRYLGFEGRI